MRPALTSMDSVREYIPFGKSLAFDANIPPLEGMIRQINTILSWYLWKGSIFRVPLSMLHRPKRRGGWQLIHMEAKCQALQMCRLDEMRRKEESPTAKWLKRWELQHHSTNPPTKDAQLNRFAYLQTPALARHALRKTDTLTDAEYMRPW